MKNSFTQTPKELEKFLKLVEEDKENIQRVKNTLEGLKAEFEIHPKAESVDESVKHSPVDKNQIIKTLVFKASSGFLAVMCPGDKRVDEDKLEEITGKARMATPSEVTDVTGYVVGGVSPFDLDIPVYSADSIPKGELRPAAGSRVVGVKINRETLFDVVNAKIVDVN